MLRLGKVTKTPYALILVLTAFLFALANSSSLAVAQPAAASFAGTTWVSIKKYGGGISTITFEANGHFNDTWKTKHTEGSWVANADNTEITTYPTDGDAIKYTLNADKHLVRDPGNKVYKLSSDTATASPPKPAVAAVIPGPTVTPEHSAPTVKLTENQARAVVLIKGDNAEGTGFLIKTADGPVVVTNIHVISNNPNLQITTNTGTPITILSYKGASDRDLAMIAIKDGNYSYLELATDISATVQPGDEVITPGNSEGGEVVLNTDGKVLGLGPDRIEFDNPVYHGNSGGPVIHVKSGKVIGVVTEAVKVDVSDELDKASFANRNSAISHSMRYFGMRVDNVPKWEPYDWKGFQNETAFLDQFDQLSRSLDSYLNAPDDDKPEDTLWQKDAKIMKANEDYIDLASGADASQQMDATRALYTEIRDIADADMEAIQNSANFYGFDQQRAKDEIAYREAIKKELDTLGDNVSRLGSLPRTNK